MATLIGNIIDLAENGDLDVIVHGCNCFCTMGKGLAWEIRQRYPEAYEADCFTPKGDISKLGGYSWVRVLAPSGYPFLIINAYTQYKYGDFGPNRPRHVDYNAISSVFKLMAQTMKYLRIGYPKIGAGLGGGDWDVIQRIINAELVGMTHFLVKLGGNYGNV